MPADDHRPFDDAGNEQHLAGNRQQSHIAITAAVTTPASRACVQTAVRKLRCRFGASIASAEEGRDRHEPGFRRDGFVGLCPAQDVADGVRAAFPSSSASRPAIDGRNGECLGNDEAFRRRKQREIGTRTEKCRRKSRRRLGKRQPAGPHQAIRYGQGVLISAIANLSAEQLGRRESRACRAARAAAMRRKSASLARSRPTLPSHRKGGYCWASRRHAERRPAAPRARAVGLLRKSSPSAACIRYRRRAEPDMRSRSSR